MARMFFRITFISIDTEINHKLTFIEKVWSVPLNHFYLCFQIVWLWKNINSLILDRGIQQRFCLFNSPVVNVLLVGSTIEVTGSSIIVHHTEIFQFGTTLCYRINKYTCKRRRCKLEKIYAHPPKVNIIWNKYNLLT